MWCLSVCACKSVVFVYLSVRQWVGRRVCVVSVCVRARVWCLSIFLSVSGWVGGCVWCVCACVCAHGGIDTHSTAEIRACVVLLTRLFPEIRTDRQIDIHYPPVHCFFSLFLSHPAPL